MHYITVLCYFSCVHPTLTPTIPQSHQHLTQPFPPLPSPPASPFPPPSSPLPPTPPSALPPLPPPLLRGALTKRYAPLSVRLVQASVRPGWVVAAEALKLLPGQCVEVTQNPDAPPEDLPAARETRRGRLSFVLRPFSCVLCAMPFRKESERNNKRTESKRKENNNKK